MLLNFSFLGELWNFDYLKLFHKLNFWKLKLYSKYMIQEKSINFSFEWQLIKHFVIQYVWIFFSKITNLFKKENQTWILPNCLRTFAVFTVVNDIIFNHICVNILIMLHMNIVQCNKILLANDYTGCLIISNNTFCLNKMYFHKCTWNCFHSSFFTNRLSQWVNSSQQSFCVSTFLKSSLHNCFIIHYNKRLCLI